MTMTGRGAGTVGGGGGNLILAAILALLSYAPFEYVAKISLVVNMILFIVDPFPPNSRLLSLVSTLVVASLSAAHKHWQEQEQQRQKEEQEIFEDVKEGEDEKRISNNEDAQSNVDSGDKKSQ